MINNLEKNKIFATKKLIISMIVIFLIYFIINTLMTYVVQPNTFNYIFGSDAPRVLDDWTKSRSLYNRTKVHPLYIILIFPIIKILQFFTLDSTLAVTLFLSIISTVNVLLIYKILSKILKDKKLFVIAFTLLFAFSFSVIENLTTIECFSVGAFTLLLFWCWFLYNKNKNFTKKDYLIIILLGVLTMSITITNFIQFVIGLMFLILFNKKKTIKEFFLDLLKYIAIIILVILIVFFVGLIQYQIFPNSKNAIVYFIQVVKDFINGTSVSEEATYINFSPNMQSIRNVIYNVFGFAFIPGRVAVNGNMIVLNPNILTTISIILMISITMISVIISLINKKWFVITLTMVYISQMILHLFYGNNELIIYVVQFSFIIIIILALAISCIKNKKANQILLIMTFGLSALSAICSIISVARMINYTYKLYNYNMFNLFWAFLKLVYIISFVLGIIFACKIFKNANKHIYSKRTVVMKTLSIILIVIMIITSALCCFCIL